MDRLTRSALPSSLFVLLIARGGDVGGRSGDAVDLCFNFAEEVSCLCIGSWEEGAICYIPHQLPRSLMPHR